AGGAFTTDGRTDLLTINAGSKTIGLLAGMGSGRFANPVAIRTGTTAQVVRVARLNHDDISDAVLLGAKSLSVFLGNGRSGFSAAVIYDAGPDPTGLTIADANRDGELDLLVSNSHGDVLLLLGQGDGTFQPYHKTDQAVALAVADLTGNGSQDIIYADQ